jgi:bifunctional DNA-binding transcriptional regulator/antitoxin component of YhaV-PrlF toxin-antitoxin module
VGWDFLAIVKVDEKGRIQLSKELRKAAGVEIEDHLLIKPLGPGKMLLEKTTSKRYPKKDSMDWLLTHPARIRSKEMKTKISKRNATRELIEEWKQRLWTGD